MKLDQLLLGQIPEAIYFALFMILVKNIKEKRVLFTVLMILDYRYDRVETYPDETVGDFVERCQIGTYLITMPNHITTVIDGVVCDTFDCRNRVLWDVWEVL